MRNCGSHIIRGCVTPSPPPTLSKERKEAVKFVASDKILGIFPATLTCVLAEELATLREERQSLLQKVFHGLVTVLRTV